MCWAWRNARRGGEKKNSDDSKKQNLVVKKNAVFKQNLDSRKKILYSSNKFRVLVPF